MNQFAVLLHLPIPAALLRNWLLNWSVYSARPLLFICRHINPAKQLTQAKQIHG